MRLRPHIRPGVASGDEKFTQGCHGQKRVSGADGAGGASGRGLYVHAMVVSGRVCSHLTGVARRDTKKDVTCSVYRDMAVASGHGQIDTAVVTVSISRVCNGITRGRGDDHKGMWRVLMQRRWFVGA